MLVETVHLYRQIVVVFVTNAVQGSTNLDGSDGTIRAVYNILEFKASINPGKAFQKIRNLLVIGWCTPLFITIVNTKIFINRYNDTDVCYLSANDNSIWAFAAPASLVLCINLVLMITICYIISKLEYQGMRLLNLSI